MKLTIKLKKINRHSKLFNIYDGSGVTILLSNVTKDQLILGITLEVSDTLKTITIEALGRCYSKKLFAVKDFLFVDYINHKLIECKTATTHRHLKDIRHYNTFFGIIEPYIIEYPSAYKLNDELLQSVKDYSKVFSYTKANTGMFDNNQKIQVNDKWFNKAIIYNSQQSSGLLELAQKPVNNMAAQMQFPKLKTNSKVILYTRTDNLYQYNTFWAVQKNSQVPLFLTSCDSLSIDKVINNANMEYTNRSFRKAPLKAKDCKIRHILDDSSDVNIVSQFLLSNTQISYK